MRSVILLALLGAAPLAWGVDPQPYCDGYKDVLTEAAADRRRGYPNYAGSLITEEWASDVDFIFRQSRGFDYASWINERYRECWEETPYGPEGSRSG